MCGNGLVFGGLYGLSRPLEMNVRLATKPSKTKSVQTILRPSIPIDLTFGGAKHESDAPFCSAQPRKRGSGASVNAGTVLIQMGICCMAALEWQAVEVGTDWEASKRRSIVMKSAL